MSYRYFTTPDRAVSQVLSAMLTRLSAAERRLRWNGATQFDDTVGPVGLTEDVFTTVACSITLDRGSWLIMGGFQMTHVESSGTTFTGSIIFESTPSGVFFGGSANAQVTRDASTNAQVEPLTLFRNVKLTADSTVIDMLAWFSVSGGSGTASFENAYLIAVPA